MTPILATVLNVDQQGNECRTRSTRGVEALPVHSKDLVSKTSPTWVDSPRLA